MSAISDIKDRFGRSFDVQIESLKKKIFGVNNERLDFFMDSFYKLNPQQRGMLIGGLIAVIFAFVAGAVILYFVQVNALQAELSESFSALHKLKALRMEEKLESKRFDNIIETVSRKTRGLNFKPFFEKLSRDNNVNISNLREEKVDMEAGNPMADKVKIVKVSMKMPKISIPKLLQFLVEIEKSEKYLRISDLKITGLYGNKLYFDVNLVVRGYSLAK